MLKKLFFFSMLMIACPLATYFISKSILFEGHCCPLIVDTNIWTLLFMISPFQCLSTTTTTTILRTLDFVRDNPDAAAYL